MALLLCLLGGLMGLLFCELVVGDRQLNITFALLGFIFTFVVLVFITDEEE